MQFKFREQNYKTVVWTPEVGKVGDIFALDTETTLIVPGVVPDFVIGAAYARDADVYLLTLKHLKAFIELHQDCRMIFHNAPFDLAVLHKATGFDFDQMVRGQRIFDTGILYSLFTLADVGIAPAKWSLEHVAQQLLGVTLEKDPDVRCSFGQYLIGNKINYSAIPEHKIRYAAIDPVVTFQIYAELYPKIKSLSPHLHLSHKIQLMGAIGLDAVSRRGVGFDLQKRDLFHAQMDQEIETSRNVLAGFGYIPGERGVQKRFENIIRAEGINLPRTSSGKMTQAFDELEDYRYQSPFIDAFLNFKEHQKLKSFVEKLTEPRIHTRFRIILNTGRTSSASPNLQNLPRRPGVRECFIPGLGYCFLIIDYSTVELCTLAQVCFDRYGSSKMRDLINQGEDLHKWFASLITGKSIDQVTKEERQWAKACNFGFPGGLGIKMFIKYAANTFGISDLTEEKAKDLKERWLNAFPEMRRYLQDSLLGRFNFETAFTWTDDPELASGLFKRIIGGVAVSTKGKPYPQETLDTVFKTILPELRPDLEGETTGSLELKDDVLRESVSTRSGRIRAQSTYCQVRNTPFQGLAADGAKIALYRLCRAGYRVVNFIHDEFILEIPESADLASTGNDVERIIVEAMSAMVPNVTIRAEWKFSDRWYKDAKLETNQDGSVRVYSEARACS